LYTSDIVIKHLTPKIELESSQLSDFLKLAGAAGALTTLPSLIPFGKVLGGTNNDTNINQTRNMNM
jgi:hypothetical protein